MQDEPPQCGQRVRYMRMREAARNGWTGTVVPTTTLHSDFAVAWDQAEDWQNPTNYSLQAFGQYVHPLEDEGPADADTYLVAGENGGTPVRVRGYRQACRQAEFGARHSNSGQRYIVYAPTEAYRRQPPPVERETFDTPGVRVTGMDGTADHVRSPAHAVVRPRDIRWDRLPGFEYVAMDHDGQWWAYRNHPEPSPDSLQWWVTGGDTAQEIPDEWAPDVDPEWWKHTLVRRP